MKRASGQYRLFNTSQMTSTAEMRRVKRDRAIKELGLKKVPVIGRHRIEPDDCQIEAVLPDESRDFNFFGVCPQCGWEAIHQLRVVKKTSERPRIWIICRNEDCTFKTPEFQTRKGAIAHWKLVFGLSR